MASLVFQFGPGHEVRMPFDSRVELAVHLSILIHGGVVAAAREIGVTRNVLFRWAQRGVTPHGGNLRGLAKAANVPASWLEADEGPETGSAQAREEADDGQAEDDNSSD
ncbi:hypothetical protein LCGC14_1068950 [marine sediment metagenome]|uniref:HTH cro/C1-type domain-containing protein n=1 Tax=marine sediment metagenome TaxID=412755 RepID=A0A0F9MIU8_9ZZZZ